MTRQQKHEWFEYRVRTTTLDDLHAEVTAALDYRRKLAKAEAMLPELFRTDPQRFDKMLSYRALTRELAENTEELAVHNAIFIGAERGIRYGQQAAKESISRAHRYAAAFMALAGFEDEPQQDVSLTEEQATSSDDDLTGDGP